jgi:hypothetical protein
MGRSQQPLLGGCCRLLHLLLAQGLEELAVGPARRTERCAQLIGLSLRGDALQVGTHPRRPQQPHWIANAASAAWGLGTEDEEVVMALQRMLRNALR